MNIADLPVTPMIAIGKAAGGFKKMAAHGTPSGSGDRRLVVFSLLVRALCGSVVLSFSRSSLFKCPAFCRAGVNVVIVFFLKLLC
ncbi:hypothetical protein GDO81_027485 [Engystomops pustulosus]|uniref:Uncharacterized protein n=1 Tax=Engystomops pustulosus TaxID=76066 RepID=A0AAV6YFT5_ENGPU|nr:hypothetical protein GDO81_027485 [Engystomops pustulosus]